MGVTGGLIYYVYQIHYIDVLECINSHPELKLSVVDMHIDKKNNY